MADNSCRHGHSLLGQTVNHFQLPQQSFYLTTSKATKNAFGAISLVTPYLSPRKISAAKKNNTF
jgi:hypothetical protein